MNLLKKISNYLFGTNFYTDIEKYHAPSKQKLMLNHFYQAETRGKVL